MMEVKAEQYWKHYNGCLYRVLLLANIDSTKKEYPPTVIYMGDNRKIWSRPLSDWHRSMTLMNISERTKDK